MKIDERELIEPTEEPVDYRVYLGTEVNEDASKKIIEELYFVDSAYPNAAIEFVINSQGGSLVDGVAIYSELYSMSLRGGGSHLVRTKIRGMAGSIAALVYQAGDQRVGGELDYMIFHEPMITLEGEYLSHVLQKVDKLVRWSERDMDILCARAKVPREQIQALVGPQDRTVFMDEAIELGLADGYA